MLDGELMMIEDNEIGKLSTYGFSINGLWCGNGEGGAQMMLTAGGIMDGDGSESSLGWGKSRVEALVVTTIGKWVPGVTAVTFVVVVAVGHWCFEFALLELLSNVRREDVFAAT